MPSLRFSAPDWAAFHVMRSDPEGGVAVRAVVYDAIGQEPEVREVPEPECPAGAVVVAVRATGVCRSDWHAWRGHDPVSLPHVPGHEFAGEVVRVGEGVIRVAVGDRVTAPFVCGCGACEFCRNGDAQVCPDQYQPGFTGPGSFAEQVMVPAADTNVVRLPGEVGFVEAAALGCRFATAFRAVQAHGRVRPGQWLAVFGCGGVGLSAVMVGRALGARVVAVDVSAAALEQAGRHGQVGLLLGEDAATAMPMDRVLAHELEVIGSHGMAAVDYPAMLDLVEQGLLDPRSLVNRVIGLDEAGAALAAMDRPGPPGLTVVEI